MTDHEMQELWDAGTKYLKDNRFMNDRAALQERIDQLETAVIDAKDVVNDYVAAKQRIDALEKQLGEAQSINEKCVNERIRLTELLTTLKANFVPAELRIKQLEADCAVMREALEHYRPYHQGSPRIDKALSTDSGKALLAQLQAHQQALKEAKGELLSSPGWNDHRFEIVKRINRVLGHICPECNGTGSVNQKTLTPGIVSDGLCACQTCKGTGSVLGSKGDE